MSALNFTDEQIIAAIDAGNAGPGGRAAHILRRLGVNYAKPDDRLRKLYQRLCKMERAGLVHRSERYSYVNSIYWMVGASLCDDCPPDGYPTAIAGGQCLG